MIAKNGRLGHLAHRICSVPPRFQFCGLWLAVYVLLVCLRIVDLKLREFPFVVSGGTTLRLSLSSLASPLGNELRTNRPVFISGSTAQYAHSISPATGPSSPLQRSFMLGEVAAGPSLILQAKEARNCTNTSIK